jgi:hypothetical protein
MGTPYIAEPPLQILEVREEGVREGGGRVQQFGDGEVDMELGWGGHHLPIPRLLDQVSLHLLQC